jgi:hypothetical protein
MLWGWYVWTACVACKGAEELYKANLSSKGSKFLYWLTQRMWAGLIWFRKWKMMGCNKTLSDPTRDNILVRCCVTVILQVLRFQCRVVENSVPLGWVAASYPRRMECFAVVFSTKRSFLAVTYLNPIAYRYFAQKCRSRVHNFLFQACRIHTSVSRNVNYCAVIKLSQQLALGVSTELLLKSDSSCTKFLNFTR